MASNNPNNIKSKSEYDELLNYNRKVKQCLKMFYRSRKERKGFPDWLRCWLRRKTEMWAVSKPGIS